MNLTRVGQPIVLKTILVTKLNLLETKERYIIKERSTLGQH